MRTRTDFAAIVAQFSGKRIVVVGDLMLDEHIGGNATRVSPEAPVLVIDAKYHTFVPGGAANVVRQLTALGAQVTVAGVVGEDEAGERLKRELAGAGSDIAAIVTVPGRPTTLKTRIIAGNQQVVRVDREERTPIATESAERLITAATEALSDAGALLFSDYDKGVLGRDTVQSLMVAAKERGIVVTANPKPTSAYYYAGADVVQFNKVEADAVIGSHRFEEDLPTFHEAGVRLREILEIENLLVTRGSEGLTLFHVNDTFTDIGPHRVDVFDVTGAGDSTIAGLTLALASGAEVDTAAEIGNAAGGAVVRKFGVVAASRDEILQLLGETHT